MIYVHVSERLDQDTGGILTTMCNHSFHCSCISNWPDSSCPVRFFFSFSCQFSDPLSIFLMYPDVVLFFVFRFVDIASSSLKIQYVVFAKQRRISGCVLSVGLLAAEGMDCIFCN